MKISLYNITKDQTQIIKAFAIIAITFHNFLHWTNSIGENEMSFSIENVRRLSFFIKENPAQILDALFSYFGHYGVQLFIFISGYGLTKQFLQKGIPPYKDYIIARIVKIYSLLLWGIIFCFFLYITDLHVYVKYVVLLSVTMLKNISYKYLFAGIGPWWYFSLALQLYILFPFLYRFITNKGKKGFYYALLLSYVLIFLFLPLAERLTFPIFGNAIGHLPEFILGITLASVKDFRITITSFVIFLILFILSNFFSCLFPFSFISITIVSIIGIKFIIRIFPKKLNAALIFVGKISMFIFVINGPIRKFSFFLFFEKLAINTFIASILHFCLVLLVSYIMYVTYVKSTNWLRAKTKIPI